MKNNTSDAGASPNPSNADLLLQLAERCEREKPSDDLDLKIATASGWRFGGGRPKGGAWIAPNGVSYHGNTFAGPPKFTTSLDSAVTLVPENRSFELTFSAAGDGALRRARLWDWRRSATGLDPGNEWLTTGKTLPLALCAAALRARAALANDRKGND